MNKTTKGSLAAGAAAVLLLGGAGSLAYWTDAATVDGGSVNSGFLTLKSVPTVAANPATNTLKQDCTTPVYAVGFANAGTVVKNIVPGDVVSTACTFVIGAKGDNLSATPTIPATLNITPTPAAASFKATVASTYTLNGTAYTGATPITEANNGQNLVATITVKIPYGTDQTGSPIINGNDTQNIKAALSALTVSLKQNTPNVSNP